VTAVLSPGERYAALIAAFVGKPGVTFGSEDPPSRRAFGSGALKVDDRIFAMLVRERLVVKLPRKRVDSLVEKDDGERFDPGHGRLMKEWLALDPRSEQDWEALTSEALEFVGARRRS
jgi:TfoX/Sxy family transcriptional regulator of competence genes